MFEEDILRSTENELKELEELKKGTSKPDSKKSKPKSNFRNCNYFYSP